MTKGNRQVYERLIPEMQIKPDDKILEIGFGPGIGINMISEKFEGCKVYGIDFSELMFKKASIRNKKFIDDKSVKLIFRDFIKAEIDENDFDKVFCINVIYFWEDLEAPFKKIWSMLKDNGQFHLYMATKEDLDKIKFTKDSVFNKYSIGYVVKSLENVGFQYVHYYYNQGYYMKAIKQENLSEN